MARRNRFKVVNSDVNAFNLTDRERELCMEFTEYMYQQVQNLAWFYGGTENIALALEQTHHSALKLLRGTNATSTILEVEKFRPGVEIDPDDEEYVLRSLGVTA